MVNKKRTSQIIVTRGLPGSGKSTWAFEQLKQEPGRFKRINNDHIRLMCDGGWSTGQDTFLNAATQQLVHLALSQGYDVILDNTYLNQRVVNKVHQFAASYGDVMVIEKVFPTSIEECVRRNALREGHARIPEKAIHDMARAAKIDKHGFKFIQDKETYYERKTPEPREDLPKNREKAIICDLDGTLAIINGRDPYDASNCDNDLPNIPVVETVKAMYDAGYQVIFVSGRNEKYREKTKVFIEHYCTAQVGTFDAIVDVPIPYKLFMRKDEDYRDDRVVKREIYEEHIEQNYDVLFVLDDRPKIVRTWRYEIGLPVFAIDDREF
jgi:predicted kinase